jgi:hypothetical protein
MAGSPYAFTQLHVTSSLSLYPLTLLAHSLWPVVVLNLPDSEAVLFHRPHPVESLNQYISSDITMLLQVVFLWLAACLQALALNAATPWETLYFYSVYKAELAAGVSTKTTGGGCVQYVSCIAPQTNRTDLLASAASNFEAGEDNYKAEIAAAGYAAGICTYDEFVKFIVRQPSLFFTSLT